MELSRIHLVEPVSSISEKKMNFMYYLQSVSCEIKFAHAHVRAHSHVCDVRAKRLLKRACDVRACGPFLAVRCALAL